jgi:putative membrane protein
MKSVFFYVLISCVGGFLFSACGGDMSNTAANSGKTATNTAEKVMNTTANITNSVANSVTSATTAGPESFLKDAAQGGMAEVELGKLASQKSQNAEIKKFGQMMVTDHTAANNELKALAAKKNITLPTDIGSHKSTMDGLSKDTGADFDKGYVDAMVKDHETDVSAFQKQADSATDADVKAFAAKTLPTLKKHLDAIKAIQAKMK